MIPQFTTDGVLPPTEAGAPYVCTRSEVEERFVFDLGSSAWRRILFDGWDLLRITIAEKVTPDARWWIWGSLITNRTEPLFGVELATVDTMLILPVGEPPLSVTSVATARSLAQTALGELRVDVHQTAYEFGLGDERGAVTQAVVEKIRARATRNVVDDATMEPIHAGFVEVVP